MCKYPLLFLLAALALVLEPGRADAYIGPGAGFAVGGSFLALFAAVFSALAMFLAWPIRFFWRLLFRKRPPKKAQFQRVVVLGLDGLDHGLTQKLLAEGNSVKEIANNLKLSVKTVEAHKFNLMRKLDIHNKAQLVQYAIQKKIIKIPVAV